MDKWIYDMKIAYMVNSVLNDVMVKLSGIQNSEQTILNAALAARVPGGQKLSAR